MIDPLPAAMSFASASASQGSCSGTTSVVCALGTIASGQTAQVVIVAHATQTGVFTNTAKVAAAGLRIYEVGISYDGRTYAEGKKIGWRDGFRAMRSIVKYSPIGAVFRRS